MDNARWTARDMPSQAGRSFVVTGAGGLGYETSLALALAGAEVIIAGRNADKGAEAVAKIKAAAPAAMIAFELLDLASLASIEAFAARLKAQRTSLDVLINNAAVMAPPKRQVTADGFELQLGTNYLGHFALTARLLPLLRAGRSPRVISVSSIAARDGFLDFDDLEAQKAYKPMGVYSQSKLANLMFAFELQRRSDAQHWGVTSIAAHPGVSRTELIPNSMGTLSGFGLMRLFLGPILFQSAAHGAWPTLFAATAPDAQPGGFYGPRRMNELRGHPTEAKVPSLAADTTAAARLWSESERLTHVVFA